ncbi:MAG: orotate phosphoribosyltransferase [Planctomycetota bacterium]|jgi:orotate phosphoribosyltransferase
MLDYQEEFIRFLVKRGALKFGEFTLKSGRKSPYFVNMGDFSDGTALRELGRYFAQTIEEAFAGGYDLLFGPPYKGIALAVGAAMALDEIGGWRVPFSFNRKEIKDHGDKGGFVGHVPSKGERILLLDDVFTTGKTKEEAVDLLGELGAEVKGVVIAVDRAEVGPDGKSAIAEFESAYSIPVRSIVSVHEIIEYLYGREIGGKVLVDDQVKSDMTSYLEKWGARRAT